ncbi:dihydropteroate synthase [candidate division WOR-1 bacterium RIFOXYA12_FULL_43_27]|nr:MAG: dihydropteroate synthase [candidate division WOR-1 bacterium RIFOXYA12_FULL_43_27]OGC18888.1 MAG: dihydropteroate synthase [candidate division WOR-1 bacterium RIFOXYB2_FULL_46_45]OGC29029.1 MAG: dihydropteroate synthase [candidate division WOR-1 bacterium RIFOXYA2_FULL_46_56]
MRIIEIHNLPEAEAELLKIKADRQGIKIMAPKAVFRAVKIEKLSPTQSNIIKQEMLALGGEAAVSRGSINHSEKEGGALLLGTLQQFEDLIKKLRQHCFRLPDMAKELETVLKNYTAPLSLKIGGKTWPLGKKTYIMGILNVTPDSFSDGGLFFDHEKAIAHGMKMIEEGADIIDIGGESTRPGATPVSIKEEVRRIVPVVKKLAKELPVSIDTSKSIVTQAALEAGAVMVNDVSGFHRDPKMAKIAAKFNATVTIMHMQKHPHYFDLIGNIISYLKEGLAIARNAGILNNQIIVDPGFGFGKSVEGNLEILRRLKELKVLGHPLLVGTSRKSFIGKTLNLPVEERIEGTIATVVLAIQNGADIIRIHDVKEMKRSAKMADKIIRRRRI